MPKYKCKLCEDKGFAMFLKKEEGTEYQFIAYCHKCKKGDEYNIRGKTGYTNSISSYVGLTDAVYAENRKRAEEIASGKVSDDNSRVGSL